MRLIYCCLTTLLFSFSALASDVSEVQSIPACKDAKSTITTDDVEILFGEMLFPGPHDSLGIFLDKAKRINPQTQSCRKGDVIPALPSIQSQRVSPRALLALEDITRKTTQLIVTDLENQLALVKTGKTCSDQIVKLTQLGHTIESLKAEDFSKLNEATSKECFFFAQNFYPEIKARFKKLRILAALMDPPVEARKKISHNRPFTHDLTKMFYPGVWKTSTTPDLAPLTEDEVSMAKELKSKRVSSALKDDYFKLLSSSPILLFFNNEVTPQKMQSAFTQLQVQNKMDLDEFKKNPPQDIILMTSYLEAALEKIPEAKRGDACVVIERIFRNLKIRYDKFPQFLAQLGIVYSLVGGIGGQGVKAGFSAFLKRLGISSTVVGMAMAKDNFSKYSAAVASCSAIAAEVKSDDNKGLCNFENADILYRDGQNQVVGSAVMGSLLFGVGRALRPATTK